MSQIIRLDKKDLFQSLIAFQKQIKWKLVYVYGVFINTVYIYVRICNYQNESYVLSVKNWYTGLIKVNIRYGKNGGWKFFWMEGGYFFNMEVNTICPLSLEGIGPSIIKKKWNFPHVECVSNLLLATWLAS